MLSHVIHQLNVLGWTQCIDQDDSALTSQGHKHCLSLAMRQLNPWISTANLQRAIQALTPDIQLPLLQANRLIWQHLLEGTQVWQDRGLGYQSQTVRYVDVTQAKANIWTYQLLPRSHPFDLILRLNGLPVVLIVLDTMGEIDVQVAVADLEKYNSDPLIYCNHCVVRLGLTAAYVGTLGMPAEHYARWPAPVRMQGQSPLARLVTGLCEPTALLEMMQHFVVFVSSGAGVKLIARYPQVRAVQSCMCRLTEGQSVPERGGVVWHTQGSGKSLCMLLLTRMIRHKLPDYKVVLLTDRTQLAEQLHATFVRSQSEQVQVATSAAAFQHLLSTDTPDVVLAMMQKCRADSLGCLNTSSRIVVLIDEAHRSQYGILALTLQRWLPHAVRIAFTATPLLRSDRTRHVFGDIIDTYTLSEAIEDAVTVPLTYLRREVQVTVDIGQLERTFRMRFADCSQATQAVLQRRYLNLPAVFNAPTRIQRICQDIIRHYRQQIQPQGGKALVVTRSRQAAMLYHTLLDQLDAPPSACIISACSGDPADYTQHTDPRHHRLAIQQFRNPQHPLSMLVVNDMLLTGFDAPICQVMYLDKRMQAHGLLQAISRVNRARSGKQQGYIVDYIGLAAKLSEALAAYTAPQMPIQDPINQRIPSLRAMHTRLKHHVGEITHSVDRHPRLDDSVQNAQFYALLTHFSCYMRHLMPTTEVYPYLADWRLWQAMAQSARVPQALAPEEQVAQMQMMLDRVLQVRLKNKEAVPCAFLTSSVYRRIFGYTAQQRACAIEQSIKQYIATHINQNPDYFRRLSQQLETLLHESADDWDDLERMLLQLRDTIAANHQSQAEALGLTDCEYAFYDIVLTSVQPARAALDRQQQAEIRQIARDIVAMLQQATQIVDFFYKQDEIKSMRKQIRRRLMDSTLDRSAEQVTRRVTDQCIALARIQFSNISDKNRVAGQICASA